LVADLARFSRLSDRTWVFDLRHRKWSELHSGGKKEKPPERAYHAAVVVGDYMVIFGGYSHRHNLVEACYDKEIYFYHLGCHTWVSKNILDKGTVEHRKYPGQVGLFGSAIALKEPNIIVYSGGYRGSVSGRVWAFTFPLELSVPNNKHICPQYGMRLVLQHGCLLPKDLHGELQQQPPRQLLPRDMPRSQDCYSCVLHGRSPKQEPNVVDQLRLRECGWCVHSQSCLPRYATPDPCSLERKIKRDSAAKLTSHQQCTRENFMSGITLFKYSHPPNATYPDFVSIINKTEAEFVPFLNEVLPSSRRRGEEQYVLRIRGSVHVPHATYSSSSYSLNGSSDEDKNQEERYLLPCVRNAAQMLLLLSPRSTGKLRTIINGTSFTTTSCRNNLKWPESGSPIILRPGTSYQVDFSATASLDSSMVLKGFFQPPLELSLKSGIDDEQIIPQVFDKDFLRPFRGNGSCVQYSNCLTCTADTLCGWCSGPGTCLARGDGNLEKSCRNQLLTLDSSQCIHCSSHIYCETCSSDPNCEYRNRDSHCVRRGSSLRITKEEKIAVWDPSECPEPCSSRETCSECLGEPGRCVWCAETQECFLFSVYTSEYRYGRCREWFDRTNFYHQSQDSPEEPPINMCSTCSNFSKCSDCIQSLGCGWCYDPENPVQGTCSGGTFLNSSDGLCSSSSSSWAYSSCPDVDECSLGLDNCHGNATCRNLPGSFSCECKRGFLGDGVSECSRTCYEDCVQGDCVQLSPEDFQCECHLGWTGVDCSLTAAAMDTPVARVALESAMSASTTRPGRTVTSVGRAALAMRVEVAACLVSAMGTRMLILGSVIHNPEAATARISRLESPARHVSRNTLEIHQMVGNAITPALHGNILQSRANFAADAPPKVKSGSFGSYGGNLSIERDCLWIIGSSSESPVNLMVESLNVSCSENSVYIYDGLPPFISSPDSSILGIICNEDGYQPNKTFIARSGRLSIYYQRSEDPNQGFNASFTRPEECLEECEISQICPNNCSMIGECIRSVCVCPLGTGSDDCSLELPSFTSTRSGHSFRFGHSMDIDLEETLWIYGGSSGINVLNDIRPSIRGTAHGSESRFEAKSPSLRTHHLDDFWSFDVITRRWKAMTSPLVALAGHSLSLNPDVARFILIGGVSAFRGFNDKVLEYNPLSETWDEFETTGFSPLAAGGIYGHSVVYHEGRFYVYGGVSFYLGKVEVSDRLFSLDYASRFWSLHEPFINVRHSSFPLAFHAAVTTPDVMIAMGGDPAHSCSSISSVRPGPSSAMMRAFAVYWVSLPPWGRVLGSVRRLDVPNDFCRVYDRKKYICKFTTSCSYCSVFDTTSGSNSSFCYSKTRGKEPTECRNFSEGIKESNDGFNCHEMKPECRDYYSCGTCTSFGCRWCSGCNRGQCVHKEADCGLELLCNLKPKEVLESAQCPEMICSASDCETCTAKPDCVWTRKVHKSGEQKRKVNGSPIYDWNCEQRRVLEHGLFFLKKYSRSGVKSLSEERDCPAPCTSYKPVSPVFPARVPLVKRARGVPLSELFAPALYGGHLWTCSEASLRENCKACLQRSDCGWCSYSESHLSGMGSCLRSEEDRLCQASSLNSSDWHYALCPPEDECSNGHHDCDPESEVCIDTEGSYACVCNEGYEAQEGKGCQPICDQGCMHGDCVKPGVCQCHFSFVGDDCSKECLCNGHSECAGPDHLDVCSLCRNNTMGAHCEKCARFYVGDPRNGGSCISCYDFCNTHSNYCFNAFHLDKLNVTEDFQLILDDRSLQRMSKSIESGPREESETVCVNCQDFTRGRKCEDCLDRHFRGTLNKRSDCRPCWCNGHGNTCNKITGANCLCYNNTLSDLHKCARLSLYGTEPSSCFKYQCSLCNEYFLGQPENGHQCYRVMTVDTEHCFDPDSKFQCDIGSSALKLGQATFFAVQPKFMNVDIRIVIDVSLGEVDVYLAPDSQIFVVENDPKTWHHNVSFDPRYGLYTFSQQGGEGLQGRSNRSAPQLVSNLSDANIVFRLLQKDITTQELSFIKIEETETVLIAKGLRNRLVISLPEANHDLRTTRFHIVIVGRGLYFRQDQLHIDLFVFFSVFFSCFFLFLSFCVLMWKCKILSDLRVEMMHMAQRPFTKFLIILNRQEDSSNRNAAAFLPPPALGVEADGMDTEKSRTRATTLISTHIFRLRWKISRTGTPRGWATHYSHCTRAIPLRWEKQVS
ncbi:Uncharacterized protein FKW44_012624, partial [Caligus rogercresseyi]